MSTRARRPLRTLDVMWLTGSAAVGMGVFQLVWRTLFQGWWFQIFREGLSPRVWDGEIFVYYCSDLVVFLIPVAGAWMFLLPLLRWTTPGAARSRRVWREPGMAACLAALVGWGWGVLSLAGAYGINRTFTATKAIPPHVWLEKFFAYEALMYPGLAVAGAWICLALGGRWRSADTLDLLGRFVGVCWILVGFVWTVREYLQFL
jgi:hypothetical protein